MLIHTPGWHTSIAMLGLMGQSITDRGNSLVITPQQAAAGHLGGFLFIKRGVSFNHARHWIQDHRQEFPEDSWITIGFDHDAQQFDDWRAHGFTPSSTTTLVLPCAARPRPLIEGYDVRPITWPDWVTYLAGRVHEPERTLDPVSRFHGEFATLTAAHQKTLSAQPQVHWLGAFYGHRLAAEVAVATCGNRARIYRLFTEFEHRRRGLAAHLLTQACNWANAQGCEEIVLHASDTSNTGRIARRIGFAQGAPDYFIEWLDVRSTEPDAQHVDLAQTQAKQRFVI